MWERARRIPALVGLLAALSMAPAPALAVSTDTQLAATLDGKPLPLKQIGNWYCNDFAYPLIRCYSNPGSLEVAVNSILSATAVNYVIVYDYTTFGGSYMYMSQDYTALVTIGWNDRISSFVALNGEDGHFYTDWFYGGTGYYFCCNQQVSSLGSYDNTFSSVHRG